MKHERISDKMIAIDTEYHTDSIGRIDNVYCVCTTDNKGNHFKKWTSNTKDANILNEIAEFHGIENPIFICHAFDKAERRAFKFLGVENRNHKFICTWHLARMLKYSSFQRKKKQKDDAYESESEAIDAAQKAKQAKAKSLSYASLCEDILKVNIDTAHKDDMRKLCITANTGGNEQQIMDYCADDTKYLLPLLENLSIDYYDCLKKSFCPLRPGMFDDITFEDCFEYLITQCESINIFGEIADKGLPVSAERCNTVKQNSRTYREKLKREFNEKYPGCYELSSKDNLYHEKSKVIQKYLAEQLSAAGINNFPKTPSGSLSTSADILWEHFKNTDTFAEHYSNCKWTCNQLNRCAKLDENPFNYIVDNDRLWYESLNCFGSITGRCQPSTTRFIFGWPKFLYGIMKPKPGKWLVELDLSSAETIIQAAICNDENYHMIYQSKDIYLAFANKMGRVPDDDWNALPAKILKDKYGDVRKLIKPMVLGLSYGMGAKRLASQLNIPLSAAKGHIAKVNQVIHEATRYKSLLDTKASKCKAFSLPNGFICRTAKRPVDNNHTTVGNWPFQSACAAMLHAFIKTIDDQTRAGALKVELLATIHDAIFFEVDENDNDTILKVSNIMRDVSNAVLRNSPEHSMKVGKPEIVTRDKIWTPEHAFDKQFLDLLNYKA